MRGARRGATGLYRPLPNLSIYGIGLNDPLAATTNWTRETSTDPFSFTGGVLHTLDNDAHTDFIYYTPSPILGDQFAQVVFLGSSGNLSSGGLIARHQDLGGWPLVKGYYFVIIKSGGVYTWEAGRYTQNGAAVQRTSFTTSGAWGGPAANDIYRIEATGSATVTVTIYLNGSSLTSFADSAPQRSLTGVGGMVSGVIANLGTQYLAWSTWTGGPINPTVPFVYQQRRGTGYYLGIQ